MKKKLVLFDFDGTITTKDTFLEFIRYYHGSRGLYTGFLIHSPWLVLMKLKMFPNWKAKERILQHFFAGEPVERFAQKSQEFCEKVVPQLVRPGAIETIKAYLEENAAVVVVSASAENWVEPWCRSLNLNCLATRLETNGSTLTGKISGVNCYGPEKEKRIRSCYNLSDYDEIIAYGDTSGDLEMLALAQKKFYKPFRDN